MRLDVYISDTNERFTRNQRLTVPWHAHSMLLRTSFSRTVEGFENSGVMFKKCYSRITMVLGSSGPTSHKPESNAAPLFRSGGLFRLSGFSRKVYDYGPLRNSKCIPRLPGSRKGNDLSAPTCAFDSRAAFWFCE